MKHAARLLVVDDNPQNRDVLLRRLQRLGHTDVATADDGQDALDTMRRMADAGTPFDTVLLDVMMPRLSGIGVLEAMRGEPALRSTPVIMISADTELDTVVRCVELGAEDYLPKPFNPVLLRARLGTVLEKKRLRDEVARQLQRYERELAEARRQQLSMVPSEFPAADMAHPISVHATMVPAREVGGDLYDCFVAAPGILCVAVGDVSGKGMPAALFMARARSLLRASALQHAEATGAPPRPSRLLSVLNEELCKNNDGGMFVTLYVGFLEVATGRLAFANAGHLRPLRIAPCGAVSEVVTKPEPPLGVRSGLEHNDHAQTIEPGEALVVITDGLPEMMAPDGSFYSLRRVAADLAALAHAAPEAITSALVAQAQAFAAGTEAADDVTVLALRRWLRSELK